MSSLKADFDEVFTRLQHGREPGPTGFEPIYYLVFPPEQILEVKKETPGWISKLEKHGYTVKIFSVMEEIQAILKADPRYPLWVSQDRKAPQNWTRTNQSLTNAIQDKEVLMARMEAFLNSLEGQKNIVVLVTDVEALHPYDRIGRIESQLQGRFHVPAIILYPGTRTGKTQLKFLGFYHEDGNYRSVHIGGHC